MLYKCKLLLLFLHSVWMLHRPLWVLFFVFPDNLIQVKTETSEAFTRIGAKGADCVLHISPWGLTLALQVKGHICHSYCMGVCCVFVCVFYGSQATSV